MKENKPEYVASPRISRVDNGFVGMAPVNAVHRIQRKKFKKNNLSLELNIGMIKANEAQFSKWQNYDFSKNMKSKNSKFTKPNIEISMSKTPKNRLKFLRKNYKINTNKYNSETPSEKSTCLDFNGFKFSKKNLKTVSNKVNLHQSTNQKKIQYLLNPQKKMLRELEKNRINIMKSEVNDQRQVKSLSTTQIYYFNEDKNTRKKQFYLYQNSQI